MGRSSHVFGIGSTGAVNSSASSPPLVLTVGKGTFQNYSIPQQFIRGATAVRSVSVGPSLHAAVPPPPVSHIPPASAARQVVSPSAGVGPFRYLAGELTQMSLEHS